MEQTFYTKEEVIDALFYITDDNSYGKWVNVGMVLKEGGYDLSVFEDWSRQFPKYVPGCCQEKWEKLNDEPRTNGPIVSVGSIIAEAKRNGWRKRGTPLTWESPIGGTVIPKNHRAEITRTAASPSEQLRRYIEALFQPNDIIGYVITSKPIKKKNGTLKYVPASAGTYNRTASEILKVLPPEGDIDWAVGTSNPEAGAWIRINPLDGNGADDANVTAYRFALVEADEGDLEDQLGAIRALKLPTAAIVYSGGKSVHAIVHIDAPNADVYESRVETLFEVCKQNGLDVDTQNKNPSRLSRMPGVKRGDKEQVLIDIGGETTSWFEWLEVLKTLNRKKRIKRVGDWKEHYMNIPDIPVVNGIISRGEAAMLSSGSKVGKTWSMMNLAFSVLSGSRFLSMDCQQGEVLYIDGELLEQKIYERMESLCENHDRLKMGRPWKPVMDEYTYMSNRESPATVDDVIEDIHLACEDRDISLVIVDPLRAILEGDESDMALASEVSHKFIKCASDNNVAIVVVHHQTKASQAKAENVNRFSGSGAWSSSFDTIISINRLEKNEVILGYIKQNLDKLWSTWAKSCRNETEAIAEIIPCRMEFDIRHHGPQEPVNFWWRPCIHIPDEDGVLKSVDLAGANPNAKKQEAKRGKVELLEEAIIEAARRGETPVDPLVFTKGENALASKVATIQDYARNSSILTLVKSEGSRKKLIDLAEDFVLDF